jgi:hypothetical protein
MIRTSPVTITIGLTVSDRAANYIPAMDGWRPGAAQDTFPLPQVALPAAWTRADVAEALFTLTNAPVEVWDGKGGYAELARTLRALNPLLARSLSVGDTVTVDGVTLACQRVGWVSTEH